MLWCKWKIPFGRVKHISLVTCKSSETVDDWDLTQLYLSCYSLKLFIYTLHYCLLTKIEPRH